jgi:hypothetical protein
LSPAVYASALAHQGGTWLDEIIQFGLPLLVLVALYVWSSRKSGGERPK